MEGAKRGLYKGSVDAALINDGRTGVGSIVRDEKGEIMAAASKDLFRYYFFLRLVEMMMAFLMN